MSKSMLNLFWILGKLRHSELLVGDFPEYVKIESEMS